MMFIIQCCVSSSVGWLCRNVVRLFEQIVISLLVDVNVVISSELRNSDWLNMLLCLQLMNCGNSDMNSIVSFGFSMLVVVFIVSSCSGCLFGSVFILNGEWLLGCIVCYVRYSRQVVLIVFSMLFVQGMFMNSVVMLNVVVNMQNRQLIIMLVSEMSLVVCFCVIECDIMQIMFGFGVIVSMLLMMRNLQSDLDVCMFFVFCIE